ncbi:MAG TPA: MBL fold metallo-hydrolase, partial [Firmicutes bacterium]|nr:MBL fold metallo-hydrolase [Bacillota bacterium]
GSTVAVVLAAALAILFILHQHFNPAEPVMAPAAEGEVAVHFIDVGQGDSILIQAYGQNLLVDAGENDQGGTVTDYLRAAGVEKLDYVIATHPHSDHIGGMDTVLRNFSVGQVLMPELPDRLVPTTKTYTDVLDAIEELGLKVKKASPGTELTLGPDAEGRQATVEILAPLKDYDDLNEMSVLARFEAGTFSVLLGGDMEEKSEKDVLASGAELRSTVQKLSHHGSSTSNTREFIQAVQADYYIISVGAGNSYGHPSEEVLALLAETGKPVYRTDQDGSIVLVAGPDGVRVTTETADMAA